MAHFKLTKHTWDEGVSFTYRWLRDGEVIPDASESTYTLVDPDLGARVSVEMTGEKPGYVAQTQASGSVLVSQANGLPARFDRLEGPDRFSTSAVIAQEYPAGVPVVYVATGTNFPDALSAASAAASQGGPILLTTQESLPGPTRDELVRLQPALIVAVGSSTVVSDSVFDELGTLGAEVRRDAGADRFETSRIIAERAFPQGASHAYIATGYNFPDALAASGAAGARNSPVILVPGSSPSLDYGTLQTLRALGVTSASIAGSVTVVSQGIEDGLRQALGASNVVRHAGVDRFDTANMINGAEFTSADRMFIATAYNFPDALAGAALAGKTGSPLFISPQNCIPVSTLNTIGTIGVHRLSVLGGSPVLGPGIESLAPC